MHAAPPPVAIRDMPAAAFSDAHFELHPAGLLGPVTVHVRMAPDRPGETHRLGAVDLTYGMQSISLGEGLLSDIPDPNLFRLEAAAVVQPETTVIAIYLRDSRGLVEFDWTVGGGIRKIDYRRRK